ncbi:GGDEF domain-containing phosphodiesterase [Jannaschia ovalis]|uniref:GGDEF domain-containing phosphodiesterase n=1 Tax=Jannaschia ovalis TaxID=3038773 RepID=A0ABY8LD72_9RHOB|nr:GGDEF domain-containing phosphodiesterase [Jannaschia sp. GRR-S6-38]WGH79271.1 GGDEF domain-containing phosphodiesterase [Jannaschia sp. GRR-S6-38]
MPDAPDARPHPLRRLGGWAGRVNWAYLFPVFAAMAWFSGLDALALVLVCVLPVLMAFDGALFDLHMRGDRAAPGAVPLGPHPVNRATLHRVMDDVLHDCAQRGRTTAALCLQIGDLHLADDGWGSEAGQAVMDRLIHRVAATLRGQDIVMRAGEDALAVVLAPTRRADLDVTMTIVDRLQAALAEPISLDGRSVRVTSAIGICTEAMAPERTGAALHAAAECALRLARQAGPDAVRAFTSDIRDRIESDHRLSLQIEDALESGQIRPWFQPQVDARSGRLAGFEALARWHHPELGVLTPDRFLPAITAAGRAGELGEQMLRAGLEALREWDAAGLDVPCIGINVALEELADPRLAERIIWQVDRFEQDPRRVVFEILETVTLREGDETVVRNIHALRDAGFRLDLDDFGTSAASIAHIARFGVHRIKIDRSFVSGVDSDPARHRIVSAILGLAAQLDIETLAEGVETPEEEIALAHMGCAQVQGFAIARPMPFEDTIPWALSHGREAQSTLRAMPPRGTA